MKALYTMLWPSTCSCWAEGCQLMSYTWAHCGLSINTAFLHSFSFTLWGMFPLLPDQNNSCDYMIFLFIHWQMFSSVNNELPLLLATLHCLSSLLQQLSRVVTIMLCPSLLCQWRWTESVEIFLSIMQHNFKATQTAIMCCFLSTFYCTLVDSRNYWTAVVLDCISL